MNALILAPEDQLIIAVVIDANGDPAEERWKAVVAKLEPHGYELPASLPAEGARLEAQDLPSVGVWIMPNNHAPGSLEDFCGGMASEDAIAQATAAVDDAEENGYTTFRAVHRSKAILRTFLAWQDPPGLRLGEAIGRRAFDVTGDEVRHLLDWLDRMFE